MTRRGGDQRIPTPDSALPGDPPFWSALTIEQRRFSLADVRALCASLPEPNEPPVTLPGTKLSAVLVAFFEEADEARVILTKRPDTMPNHQRDIVFPGGKFHPEVDDSLHDTALREAEEEVGLAPHVVEIVAELETLPTVASRFTITPVVGLIEGRPSLVAHPREVVKVFDVSISELLDDKTYRSERWMMGSVAMPMHFYDLDGETIWGATARILTDFLAALTARRL